MFKPSRPKLGLLLYIAIGAAIFIIIGGTVWAFNQSGIRPQQLANNFRQFITRVGGFNLSVQANRLILPADGQSQSLITANLTRARQTVTASIIQGDGQIHRTPTVDQPYLFTYTAGTTPGEVMILVKAGSIERTLQLTLAIATIPAAPVLVTPPDGTVLENPKPEITGTGLPDTKIIITNNGTVNTTTRTDANGQFRVYLDIPLYNGQHTLAATAVNDLEIVSPVSNLVTVTVQTEPIKLDTANLRVAPSRVIAGESFAIFVPSSLNTAKIVAEFEGRNYELADHNQSSVFTGVLPAPNQPGAYSVSLLASDQAGNTSRFDRLIRITVVSR